MEAVSPTIDIISRLWNCSSVHTNYLCKSKQNVSSLKSSLKKLKERRDDVKQRVDIYIAESNPSDPVKCTHEVSGWLDRVETLERDVESSLQKEEAFNSGGKYFCCWGRKNCCRGYKLGKSAVKRKIAVEKLWEEGNFNTVVERSQQGLVREIAAKQMVGMEPQLEKLWSLLADDTSLVRIVGLYGMGGVGKTTLLENLNNEFGKRNPHFVKVIFVTVSKDRARDIKNIQKQIGKPLGFSWSEEESINDMAKDINQVLKNRNFMLLLDDIWEKIDLQRVGIPYIKSTTQRLTKSRIVFTTRSASVCGSMLADDSIKVNCLNWDDSWSLFQLNAGQRALSCHPNVSELAEKIAKECRGLPLALITVGQTMASKKTLQEWKYALTTLQKSASEFSGMKDEVLPILKFSYDHLQNEKLKSCFIYCSLYPEDYSINKEEIIKLWIGEGFLYEVDDMDEAYNEGHDVIESLKSACLLESGDSKRGNEIKMHDVVRDLAIWIASDLSKKKGKYLTVHAENKLKLHEWEKAEKISLVDNKEIKELHGAPNCLDLSTLLLHNSRVKNISDDFFQYMPKLNVLDMSDIFVKKLPPSMRSLTGLQYFNLSCDYIGFGATILCPGTLICLTKLKMLDLIDSGIYNWEGEGGPSLSELESLRGLNYLGISLDTGLAIQRLVNSQKLQLCTKMLKIYKCQDITALILSPVSLPLSPISSLVSLANMVSLKTLQVEWCRELEELRIVSLAGMEDEVTLFTALEKLKIRELPKLKIVWDVPHQSAFSFENLKDVSIWQCPKLKDVTWLIYAQNLETLDLCDLDELEEVIRDEVAGEVNVFSSLKSLKLDMLMYLKKICNYNVKFYVLESVKVRKCPQLMKLPFNINSVIPKTLQSIEGKKQWWERLEWEDEITKTNLANYYVDPKPRY